MSDKVLCSGNIFQILFNFYQKISLTNIKIIDNQWRLLFSRVAFFFRKKAAPLPQQWGAAGNSG
jgi:hypothetical protein